MSEYGKNAAERAGKHAGDAARGGAAAAKIAKNIASKNYAAAAKEAIFNIDALVKIIGFVLAIVILILVMIFSTLPKMLLATFTSERQAFDFTIEDIQDQYSDIKDDTIEIFEDLINGENGAYATADKASEEYGKELANQYKDSADFVTIHVNTGLSPKSPIQSSSDVISDIYKMISLYDEDKTNYSNEEAVGYLEDKMVANAAQGFTVEDVRQWSSEQFDMITAPVNVKEFKKFMRSDAPGMLEVFLPTEYNGISRINPQVKNDETTYCKVTDTDFGSVCVSNGYTDDGGNYHEPVYMTTLDVYADYIWSMDFDGVEYMLKLYGWLELDPQTGAFVLTEKAAKLFPIVEEKAYNFEMLDLAGGFDFGGGGEKEYGGNYLQLYTDEFDARIQEGHTVDRNCAQPLRTSYTISSEFNVSRYIPELGINGTRHAAIDMAVGIGNGVYAPCNGEIVAVDNYGSSGGGKVIVMYAGTDGSYTYYFEFMHLNEMLVRVGQTVRKGDLIARSGNTGRSTGPHLHFQLDRYSNAAPKSIDPRVLVPSIPRGVGRKYIF